MADDKNTNDKPKKKLGPKKIYTKEFIEHEAEELLKYINNNTILMFKEFCMLRGYPSTEASRFARVSDVFAHALKKLKDKQEVMLAKGALSSKLNTTFTIFMLKNVAGWRDKLEQKHTGDLVIKYGHRVKKQKPRTDKKPKKEDD